jgi:hypothetical protein
VLSVIEIHSKHIIRHIVANYSRYFPAGFAIILCGIFRNQDEATELESATASLQSIYALINKLKVHINLVVHLHM